MFLTNKSIERQNHRETGSTNSRGNSPMIRARGILKFETFGPRTIGISLGTRTITKALGPRTIQISLGTSTVTKALGPRTFIKVLGKDFKFTKPLGPTTKLIKFLRTS